MWITTWNENDGYLVLDATSTQWEAKPRQQAAELDHVEGRACWIACQATQLHGLQWQSDPSVARSSNSIISSITSMNLLYLWCMQNKCNVTSSLKPSLLHCTLPTCVNPCQRVPRDAIFARPLTGILWSCDAEQQDTESEVFPHQLH